jgi:hypothetical protein
MSSKYSRTIVPGLSAGSAVLTSQADIANTVESFFPTACSSDNYDSEFSAIKDSAETFPHNFTPHVAEAYNAAFSMDELLAALDRGRNTSPGPDGIRNNTHSPSTRRQGVSALSIQQDMDGERMPIKKLSSSLF